MVFSEASLKFWRSLVRQFGTNGNPFSEPANLVTNIDGGLGCWTGNAPSYYKIEIIENNNNVQNLRIEPINNKLVRLRWTKAVDPDVLHGGRVYVRHSNLTDGSGKFQN